jgi:rubrerythrin
MVDLSGVILIVVLIAAALGYTIWPLVWPSPRAGAPEGGEVGAVSAIAHDIARLLTEREKVYQYIRDIEFDREMGKLSDENYRQMIGPAREGAMAVLRRLDARGVKEGMVSLNLTEKEAAVAAGKLEAAAPVREAEGSAEAAGEGAGTHSEDLDALLEAEISGHRKVFPPGERRETAAPPVGDDGWDKERTRVNFCPSCGTRTEGNHRFCPSCGSRLK